MTVPLNSYAGVGVCRGELVIEKNDFYAFLDTRKGLGPNGLHLPSTQYFGRWFYRLNVLVSGFWSLFSLDLFL